MSRIQATFLARHGEGKIGTHAHEQEKRHHLERQAGNHDIDARLLGAIVVGRRSNATSDCLQNQREDIETDEGDGVDGRAEARNGTAIDDDDAGQTKVDGGAEECGCDGEADEIAKRQVSIDWKRGMFVGGVGRGSITF